MGKGGAPGPQPGREGTGRGYKSAARDTDGHSRTVTPGLKRCIRTRKVGIRMIRVAHVTDQKVVPLACPMRWSTEGCHGRSRTTPQASQPGLTHMSQAAGET